MHEAKRTCYFATVPMTIIGIAIANLLWVSDGGAQMFNYPPINVDPIVNEMDGMVTFTNEWSSACWIPDGNGIGTLYGEYRFNWLATASNPPNQMIYDEATMFLLHDLSDLITQDARDYNSFKVIIGGTEVTGFVFGNDNHPDDQDYQWIGATGLGYNSVDDRGYIVRINNDINTDVHWFPGDPEPGDSTFNWNDWYGFFGTYGFNNTAYTNNLPNSTSGANEIYEVVFRDFSGLESGGGGVSGTVSGMPVCTYMYAKICDPHEPRYENYTRVVFRGHIAEDQNRTGVFAGAEEMAKNVTYGNTATLDFNFSNWSGLTQTIPIIALDNQGFGVTPSTAILTLTHQQDTTITFSVQIPASSGLIGIRDTVEVIIPNYSALAWFEVADVLSRLDISPDTAYVDVGETLDCGLFSFDAGDRILAEDPTWSIVGGIGSIAPDTADHIPEEMRTALFTAENFGAGYVKAQAGSVSDSVYVYVMGGPDVWLDLSNTGPDTFYASTGGTLTYNIAAGNNEPNPQTVDIWVDLTLPSGVNYGPIVGPVQDFVMAAGWSSNRDRTLTIPANLPPIYEGTFTTNGYVGEYNPPDNIIYAEDHFDWEYVIDIWNDGMVESGDIEFVDTGEPFEPAPYVAEGIPEAYSFSLIYPNPFNPTTTLRFSLPEAARVKLSIYDVSGRLVKTLVDGWRGAGIHEARFDGSNLASGLYIYSLKAEEFSASGKMVLMK